jgi:hypothetical protein
MTDRDRLARVFGAAMAGMTYDEFLTWAQDDSEPPEGQDEDEQPAEPGGEDSDDPEGAPSTAPKPHP